MRTWLFGLALLTTLTVRSGAARSADIVVSSIDGSRVAPLGGRAPDRASGSSHARVRKGTVLIYITNDCPIANACAPEIERIYRRYSPKQIAFYLVYVDAALSADQARKHHQDFQYTCPAVLDPKHLLVRAGHATVTPEAAVFSRDGRMIYHGRIDDRAAAFGQVRSVPTRHELRAVLDCVEQGKPVHVSETPGVGCYIADLGTN